MKKYYKSPDIRIRIANRMCEVIVTSDPQLSDDPSDGGKQQIKRPNGSSDWENYE